MASEIKSSSGEVCVVCKLESGLYLDVRNEAGVVVDRKLLKGTNSSSIRGMATFNMIPENFWNAWIKQHSGHPAVVNGLIFAHAQKSNAIEDAKDREKEKSGFQPIDVSQKKGGGMADERLPVATISPSNVPDFV